MSIVVAPYLGPDGAQRELLASPVPAPRGPAAAIAASRPIAGLEMRLTYRRPVTRCSWCAV